MAQVAFRVHPSSCYYISLFRSTFVVQSSSKMGVLRVAVSKGIYIFVRSCALFVASLCDLESLVRLLFNV